MTEEYKKFANALIKQGNSFCIRVPSSTVKELNAKTGDFMDVRIRILPMEATDKNINPLIAKLKKIKKLDYLNEEKLTILSLIYFNEGKSYMGTEVAAVIGGQTPKNMKELENKTKNMILEYEKKVLKNYGEKMYIEYKKFKGIVNKEVEKYKGLNW